MPTDLAQDRDSINHRVLFDELSNYHLLKVSAPCT